MFTFSVTDVRAVITRGRIDAFSNGGFRGACSGAAESHERPGLWLVGDEGVYIMSNGRLDSGQRPLVVYAAECDPRTNAEYWHFKQRYFGGDDGVEFLDAVMLVKLITASPEATHLQITLTDSSMLFNLIRR